MAEKKINGAEYRSNPLTATEALELYADMMRIATRGTRSVVHIISALKIADERENTLVAELAKVEAMGDLLQQTTNDEFMGLLKRIVSACEVKRPSGYAEIDFDEEFSDSLNTLYSVCEFVLEAQYKDFFIASAGLGIIRAIRKAFAQMK